MNDAARIRQDGLTSIIVVSADSGPLLRTAITRALASTAAVELILVDNASVDGEPERVLAMHAGDERLRVVHNAENLGFGPACNRGAELARGDALLFLNPDCLLAGETLAQLREIAATNALIGVLGVEVLDEDGTPARGNRRRDPTLRRAMFSLSGLSRLASRWPALQGVEMPAPTMTVAAELVEAVSGACLFLPRAAFDAVGGFDEEYFLHVEDLDLCRRVRDAGFIVAIAAGIRVTHAQGTSSRHRPFFVAWHKHRGMWRYFTRFDPAARNGIARVFVRIGIWAHYALMSPVYALRALRAPSPSA